MYKLDCLRLVEDISSRVEQGAQDKLRITNCTTFVASYICLAFGFRASLFSLRMHSGHISAATKRASDMAIREFISVGQDAAKYAMHFPLKDLSFWTLCDFINLRSAVCCSAQGATATVN